MRKFIWKNRYEVINRKFILDNKNVMKKKLYKDLIDRKI